MGWQSLFPSWDDNVSGSLFPAWETPKLPKPPDYSALNRMPSLADMAPAPIGPLGPPPIMGEHPIVSAVKRGIETGIPGSAALHTPAGEVFGKSALGAIPEMARDYTALVSQGLGPEDVAKGLFAGKYTPEQIRDSLNELVRQRSGKFMDEMTSEELKAHPYAAFAGQVIGSLPLALAPTAEATAATRLKRAGQNAIFAGIQNAPSIAAPIGAHGFEEGWKESASRAVATVGLGALLGAIGGDEPMVATEYQAPKPAEPLRMPVEAPPEPISAQTLLRQPEAIPAPIRPLAVTADEVESLLTPIAMNRDLTEPAPLAGVAERLPPGTPAVEKVPVSSAERQVRSAETPLSTEPVQAPEVVAAPKVGTPAEVPTESAGKKFGVPPPEPLELGGGMGGKQVYEVAKGLGKWIERNYARSALGAIEKEGGLEGKLLGRRTRVYRETWERNAGLATANVKDAFDNLTPSELEHFGHYMEKTAPVAKNNYALRDALDTVRSEFEKVHHEAAKLGWELGRVDPYWPHMNEKPLPGQQPNPQVAISGRTMMQPARAMSYNLERSRLLNAPNYRTDFKVAVEYLNDAWRQLAEIRAFGKRNADGKFTPGNQLLKGFELVGALNKHSPEIMRLGDEFLSRLTGNETPRAFDPALRAARTATAAVALSTAPIAQLSQAAPGIAETSLGAYGRAVKDVATNPRAMFREALRSGIGELREEVTQGVLSKGGPFPWATTKMDHIMRVIQSRAANHFLEDLVKAGKTKEVQALLDAARVHEKYTGGPVSQKAVLGVAKYITDKSQLRTTVENMPIGWTTEGGRTFFQFSHVMYRYANYVQDLTKQMFTGVDKVAATKKAATFLVAAAAVGEIGADLKSALVGQSIIGKDEPFDPKKESWWISVISRAAGRERITPNHPLARAIQNVMFVGGLGVYQSITERTLRENPTEQGFVRRMASSFPATTYAERIEKGARESYKEGSLKPLARRAAPSIFRRFIPEKELSRKEELARIRKEHAAGRDDELAKIRREMEKAREEARQ